MKKLNDPRKFTAPNAWGRDDTSLRQAFIIEPSDVGMLKADYGGHRQPARMISTSDVGRVIEVTTYPGQNYRCWSFGSVFQDIRDSEGYRA